MEQIRFFRKRSGRIVNFRIQKIADAIAKALTEACTALASQVDAKEASMKLAEEVKGLLDDEHSTYFVQPDSVGSRIPRLEHVQDTVVHVISEPHVGITGYDATFAEMTGRLYSEYRRRREEARKLLKVRSEKDNADVTDKSLLLSDTAQSLEGWERERIIKDLEALHIDADKAEEIAKEVERVLLKSGLHSVSSELITELVNNELVNRGMRERIDSTKGFQVSEDFINGLIREKTVENSNIVANNPEAASFDIANVVWKQYALKNIFSPDVVKAHSTGAIHLHDLNFPTRGYCGSHSLEYLKKWGLKGLVNLNTTSKPAKTASVLTGHLNTFLASMQAYYAGALGLGYVNILYAPLLVGATDKELKQIGQELIFNCSQNAFSRGGQSLHPSELVWIKRDGRYQSVRIGEFVDKCLEDNKAAVEHRAEYELLNTAEAGIQAISFDSESGKVLDKPISYVARMPHKGTMYRVHTSNGIVNITGDHSLFAFRGKQKIEAVKAKDLKRGDFVVIPHRVPLVEEANTVDITKYIPEEWLSVYGADAVFDAINARGNATKVLESVGATRYIMKDGKKTNKVRLELAKHFVDTSNCTLALKGDSQATLPAIIPLNRDLGYIAGIFCAEGHKAQKKVLISNADKAIIDKITGALDSFGYSHYRYYNALSKGATADNVEVSGILGSFISCSCTDDKSKVVPNWVFNAPDECVNGFIEGFYDGESSNRTGVPEEWSVSNTSTRVVAGISLLRLKLAKETYIYETKHDHSTWSDCYEIRESQYRKVNPFTENTTVDGYQKYSNHINKEIRDAVDWLIDSDLSVSFIKKIEEYEYEGPVYDLSVPGTEAFLGGIGNVFFHNTLFIDTNIHSGIPSYLENVPAIGPGGHYYADADGINTPLEERTIEGDWCLVLPAKEEGQDDRILLREHEGKQTFYDDGITHVMRYGDYKEEAARFAEALLEVWKEGDANGHVFEFPKCDFHVSAETFTDARQYKVFQKACELASHNGSTYFVFDRDSVSLASCCFAPMTPVLIKDGTDIHRMSIVGAYAHYSKTNKTIRVYDRGAWRKAKVIRLKGKGRRMLTIKFACNKEVTCTADHEFPTKDGVKKAYELTPNDLVEMSTEVLKNRGDSGFARLCGALATLAVFTKHPKGQGKLVFDVCNDIDGVKIGMDEFLLGALRDAGIKDGFAILPSDKGTYIEITNPEIINGVEELYTNVEGACCFSGRIYNTHEEARFAVLLAMLAATVAPVEMETEQAEYLTNQLEAIATTVGVTLYNDPSEEGRLNFSPTFVGVKDKILNYGEKSYIKIESIEEAPEENWVYCFSMMDTKKPFFTLPSGVVTHNCRLKVQITDMSLLEHPERLRTLGFQNVTINLPQCAYRAKHRMEAEGVDTFERLNELFIEEIDHMMDLCKAAHAQKRKFIESIMVPGAPMWQMAMPSNDGKPYLNLDTAVYIIGMLGLNDAIHYLTGEEMHESDAAMDYALKIMSHMFLRSKEYSKETGLTFKLEESPAESAARRLAKADLVYYRDDALKVFKGTEDAAYYTNSIHLAAAAPVTLVERIRKQSMFHSVIESGAIIHAFIAEETPSAGAIEEIVTQTFLKTQCAQLVFSPEFTYCNQCASIQRGLVDHCDQCGSHNVVGETRVVGYYSRVQNWSKSKRYGELVDRHKGKYRVEEAQ